MTKMNWIVGTKKYADRIGFTLIELLVVIAIISLLVSILLPSLDKARTLARELICKTNLKSMGVGLAFYAEDSDGRYPIPYGGTVTSDERRKSEYHSWPVALAAYMLDSETGLTLNRTLTSSPNASYAVSQSVVDMFLCPDLAKHRGNDYGPTYAMNSRSYGEDNFHYGLKVDAVTYPAKTLAITDAAFYTSGWYSTVFYSAREIGLYHHDGEIVGNSGGYEQTNGEGNALLVDGHVDSMSYEQLSDVSEDGEFSVQPFPGG